MLKCLRYKFIKTYTQLAATNITDTNNVMQKIKRKHNVIIQNYFKQHAFFKFNFNCLKLVVT